MDLSQFDVAKERQEEGVEIEIIHPGTGEKTDIVIVVASYESERVKAIARQIGDKLIADQRKGARKTESIAAMEERALSISVASIVDWRGIEDDGKPFPFTRENALALLQKYGFIAEQIDEAAKDRKLFFGN